MTDSNKEGKRIKKGRERGRAETINGRRGNKGEKERRRRCA